MNTKREIELEDRITGLESEIAVKARIIEELETENARLQNELDTSEASRAAWEKKAAEMSTVAFLRLMQLESADIEAVHDTD